MNSLNATASLTDCTISGNSTGGGGGGLGTSSGTLTLTNCTVSGNSAYGGGGGVADFGVVSLTNCTVSGNYAYGNGGGLENYGTATLGNTIVAGNTANTNGPDVYGAVTSLGHNLIGETGDGSSGWVGSDLTGTIATPLQPLLAPLDSYGGPTETMALLPGSPAIDAGSNALVPGGVTTDQRGYARIVHGTVDIGAFEVQPIPLLVNTTAEGGGCPPGVLDLSGAIGLANITPGAATISFAPTIFAGHQTITLSAGQLELSNTTGTETITGPAAGVTVSANGLSRVFQVDAGVTASITGLTITGGNSSGGGGGVLNYGTLSLTNCTVSGNSASGGNGGGVANDTGAKLTMTNCTVSGNSATFGSFGPTGYGGGVYNEGTATLTHCTVSGNSASGAFDGGGGGGVDTGAFFSNNDGSATTTLYGCTISHNSASGKGGGVANYGATTLNDCTISSNSAGDEGGGVLNSGAVFGLLPPGFVSRATLINCTISGNTAGSGGGVATTGTSTPTNCAVEEIPPPPQGRRPVHRGQDLLWQPYLPGIWYDQPEQLPGQRQRRDRQWRRLGHLLSRHDHRDQHHRQSQLRGERRRVVQRWLCLSRQQLRHDQPEQLHRQRQLGHRQWWRLVQLHPWLDHDDAYQRQRQLRRCRRWAFQCGHIERRLQHDQQQHGHGRRRRRPSMPAAAS